MWHPDYFLTYDCFLDGQILDNEGFISLILNVNQDSYLGLFLCFVQSFFKMHCWDSQKKPLFRINFIFNFFPLGPNLP